jgi:hypothetical protein
MLTIGPLPQKIKSFFYPHQDQFGRPAFGHFWRLVLAICVCHGATIDRLVRAMRSPCHRTKHGEFLWKSRWDHASLLQETALATLLRLYRRNGGSVYLIVDEVQVLKRGKKMAAVGTIYHHSTGRFARGHTFLKLCLYYRGVIVPWGNWLYVKKEQCAALKKDFCKLTDLAAQAIAGVNLPDDLKVTVLFDAWYLCPQVVKACNDQGWHWISVARSNRNLKVAGEWKRIGDYGQGVLKRSGGWHRLSSGLGEHSRSSSFRLAERIGTFKKVGEVKVIFSRRRGENRMVTVVTDDLHAAARCVVADYLKRWAIELLIKEEKQQLGLGDYRVLRYEAVVRHLHLVDSAYGCLTHLALNDQSAQGKKDTKMLHLPPISQLKTRMRQVIWQEAVEDVIKNSHERPVIRRLEKLLAA